MTAATLPAWHAGHDDPSLAPGGDQHADAYDQGYADGHACGLAERPDALVLAPVPIGWRHVRAGDVFRDPRGRLWSVLAIGHAAGGLVRATVTRAGLNPAVADLDPDERVEVLYEVPERDAITLVVEQLGARLIEGRSGS